MSGDIPLGRCGAGRGSSQQEQSEGGIQELGMLGDMSTCWDEKTEAILCAQLSEKHLDL